MRPTGHRLLLLPHLGPRAATSVSFPASIAASPVIRLHALSCISPSCTGRIAGYLNGISGGRPCGPPSSPCRPPSRSAFSTLSCLLRRSAHGRCSSSTACASPPCGLPGPSVYPSAILSAPPRTLASLSRSLISSSPYLSHALLCSSPFPPCAPHVVQPACGRCCTCAFVGTPGYDGGGGYIIPIAG